MNLVMVMAVLPGLFLLYKIYRLDKIEREPKKLILKILLFGVLSIIPTVIVEVILTDYLLPALGLVEYTTEFNLVENFLCVALIEEYFKYKAARIATWKSKEFNYKFDGIVYCATSALGFAILENIGYCIENGIGVAIMRAFLSVPAHCIFGIFMGHFYGIAKDYELRGNKLMMRWNLFLAVFLPTTLHGFDDFCLSQDEDIYLAIFIVYVFIYYFFAFKKVRAYSKGDAALYGMQVLTNNDMVEEW